MRFRSKWKEIVVLATVFGLAFVSLGLAGQHPNGWVYPAGSASRNTTSGYGDWHGYTGDGPSSWGYHVGIDYMRDIDYPIQAIAHGIVVDYGNSLGGYGGADGSSGGAILIHHTAQGHDGFARSIYAVYGHTYKIPSLGIGDIVEKGDIIGYLHFYSGPSGEDWTHLHFGIRPDKIDPDKQFRGVASNTSSDNGWTCPLGDCNDNDVNTSGFLDDNFPGYAEVNCQKLREKYPDQMNEIGTCIKAYYLPEYKYIVQYRPATGENEQPTSNDYKTFGIQGHTPIEVALGAPSDGYGGGGIYQLSPEPPEPIQEDSSDGDIHIISNNIRIYKIGFFVSNLNLNATPNQAIQLETEARVQNQGSREVEVDIDHRVDPDKDRFDENDTNMGDDKEDIPAGAIEISHSPRILVTVASDGNSVYVQGDGRGERFPIINGIVNLYFFVDAEIIDGGSDKDISSRHNSNEYAKVTIYVSGSDSTDDDNDGFSENQGDCNDSNSSIHPNATEICGDGIDQDCNGVDEVCEPEIDYRFEYATVCENIEDKGDFFYEPIGAKGNFEENEDMHYLAKITDVSISYQFKIEIEHQDGWGWNEEWPIHNPDPYWDYSFFKTKVTNPESGAWTFSFYIKVINETSWKLLKQMVYPFAQIISKLRVSKLLISGRYFSKFSKNSIVALRKSANDS